jgi:UDP-3-O-[3-hydroxymyristoyl] glucosamine N-acyltransferase
MAGVGLAGSARVGNGVILAGQVGVGDHVRIGDRARLGGQAGITGNVPPGADVSGTPARSHREFLRGQAALYRVARIIDDLESLVSKRGHRG